MKARLEMIMPNRRLLREVELPALPRVGQRFYFDVSESWDFTVDEVEWFITGKDQTIMPVIIFHDAHFEETDEELLLAVGWRRMKDDELIPRVRER